MNEEKFRVFLKKSGRKPNVIEKYIKSVTKFENYISTQKQNKVGEKVTINSLTDFISDYESKANTSARSILYALMQYFKATENDLLYKTALELREPRKVKKTPFLLKKILNIDSEYIVKLSGLGIKNVQDMISAGRTPKLREDIADKTNIPPDVILELVRISDLTRVGYVKEKLTRLYYNAGVQTPEDLVKWEAKALHKHFEQYIEESDWDGMVPNLSDLKSNIESARKLKSVVEYE